MFENMKRFTVFFALFFFAFNIQAEEKRVYSENDFINIFSGKPKARFLKYLGEPDDKEIMKSMRYYYENKDKINREEGWDQACKFDYDNVSKMMWKAINE